MTLLVVPARYCRFLSPFKNFQQLYHVQGFIIARNIQIFGKIGTLQYPLALQGYQMLYGGCIKGIYFTTSLYAFFTAPSIPFRMANCATILLASRPAIGFTMPVTPPLK